MERKQILVTSNKQKHVIVIEDIVFVKALNIYSVIYFKNGSSFQTAETITHIEAQINRPYFYRIHRSYLLNLQYINAFSKSEKKVSVKFSDFILPIARDKFKDFQKFVESTFLIK